MEFEKLMNFEDINKICRYCLDYQPELKSIFTNNNDDDDMVDDDYEEDVKPNIEIVTMTEKLLHINNMNVSDDLPKYICGQCYNKLVESYRFQAQCLLSLEFLNDLLISRKRVKKSEYKSIKKEKDVKTSSTTINPIDINQNQENVSVTSDCIVLEASANVKIKNTIKKQQNGTTNKKEQQLRICPICGVGVKEKRMTGHIYRHTNNSSFECDFCGKCLKNKNHLRSHFYIHLDIRRYKCKICDKAFVGNSSLRVHMINHTNERKFICKICNRAFSQSCGLGVHMKRHAQKRDYKCSICDLGLLDMHSLRKHEATHNTEYTFKCDYCVKAFTSDRNLKRHYRRSHITYPIKCNEYECDQEFHNLSTYNKHKRQHEYKII